MRIYQLLVNLFSYNFSSPEHRVLPLRGLHCRRGMNSVPCTLKASDPPIAGNTEGKAAVGVRKALLMWLCMLIPNKVSEKQLCLFLMVVTKWRSI